MLAWMQADFAERGIESPRLDAELLVAHALGVPRLTLYLDLDRPLSPEDLSTVRELVRRRREREPVAYLLGYREFWKRRFRVDRRVLIPRPDTETLVERAVGLLTGRGLSALSEENAEVRVEELAPESAPENAESHVESSADDTESRLEILEEDGEEARGDSVSTGASSGEAATPSVESPDELLVEAGDSSKERAVDFALSSALPSGPVIDLCTGSGCVVVSLAVDVPQREYFATDLSPDALEVARANAEDAGVSVRFAVGDLFAGLTGPFALVVANPPYVTEGEMQSLAPEVARHEPRTALVGGADGLDVVRRLASESFGKLVPGGALLVEIGADQGPATAEILRGAGFRRVVVRKDLAGRDRVVEGWRVQ